VEVGPTWQEVSLQLINAIQLLVLAYLASDVRQIRREQRRANIQHDLDHPGDG
jgi:hypothetical protein